MPSAKSASRSGRPALMGVVGALVLVALLALTSCSGGSEGGSGSTAPAPPEDASSDAFPVTIEHEFGETEIADRPTRVVSVGLTDQDALLALGVVPVGTTEWFGDHPSAVWPWAQEALGGATPEVVGEGTTLNYEQIAALEPDLIIGVYSGLEQQNYDTLSRIAPTVAQPADEVDYGVSWQEQTRIIGRAVGQSEQADELVAGVEADFAAVRAAHPEFDGATALVVAPAVDGSQLSVYAPDDVRGRLMADLGFVQPPEIAELAGEEFAATVSPERADLIDVDAVVWIVNDVVADREKVRSNALIRNLGITTEGRDVYVSNLEETGGALSFVSVLSLPFLLEQLVPQLAAALDGDPATTAPA